MVPVKNGEYMMVKNWDPKKDAPTQGGDYPYWNVAKKEINGGQDLHDGTKYGWTEENVIDEMGIPGQNNSNPPSVFSVHQVILQDMQSTKLYDPSYGVIYADLDAMDSQAMYGFAAVDLKDKKKLNIRQNDLKKLELK